MQLEDGQGQGPDGPVSFVISFSFPLPLFMRVKIRRQPTFVPYSSPEKGFTEVITIM